MGEKRWSPFDASEHKVQINPSFQKLKEFKLSNEHSKISSNINGNKKT